MGFGIILFEIIINFRFYYIICFADVMKRLFGFSMRIFI